jgi:hypothetical protein
MRARAPWAVSRLVRALSSGGVRHYTPHVNPDVADAVDALEQSGTLTAAQARVLGRVARRELVSLHTELRLLAYAGVLLVMGGVGVVVKENFDRIGPVTIAAVLGLGAAACLAWVARSAPPFSPGEVKSPHLALDYVLLLGALLIGADLAYIEANFTPLGSAWAWHLLLVALVYGALALRFDSRVVFSLALSTFVAWRGVSAAQLEHAVWSYSSAGLALRVNAVACGLIFLALGALFRMRDWKAHFEPVLVHSAWLLLLAAPLSGIAESGKRGPLFALALMLLGAALAGVAYWRRRFGLFAMGTVAAYLGVSALFVHALSGSDTEFLFFFWFAFTPIVVIFLLYLAHRQLQEPE